MTSKKIIEIVDFSEFIGRLYGVTNDSYPDFTYMLDELNGQIVVTDDISYEEGKNYKLEPSNNSFTIFLKKEIPYYNWEVAKALGELFIGEDTNGFCSSTCTENFCESDEEYKIAIYVFATTIILPVEDFLWQAKYSSVNNKVNLTKLSKYFNIPVSAIRLRFNTLSSKPYICKKKE